jgi:hypothetical protein
LLSLRYRLWSLGEDFRVSCGGVGVALVTHCLSADGCKILETGDVSFCSIVVGGISLV